MKWWPLRKTMLTCRRVVNLLSDYVDRELTPKLQSQLEVHLHDCEPCMAFVKTFQQTRAMAWAIRYGDMPSELQQRLHSFMREHVPENLPM